MSATNVVELAPAQTRAAAHRIALREGIDAVDIATSEVRIFLAATDEGTNRQLGEPDIQRMLTRVFSSIEAAAQLCSAIEPYIRRASADEIYQLFSVAVVTQAALAGGEELDGGKLCDPFENVMELLEQQLVNVRAELVRCRRRLREHNTEEES